MLKFYTVEIPDGCATVCFFKRAAYYLIFMKRFSQHLTLGLIKNFFNKTIHKTTMETISDHLLLEMLRDRGSLAKEERPAPLPYKWHPSSPRT